MQLLPPISSQPGTLRVEYLEHTKTVPASLFGLGPSPPAQDTSFHSNSSTSSVHHSLSVPSSITGAPEVNGGQAADGLASPHVTGAKDYFLVSFTDQEEAAAAAGAIVYAIATTRATAGYLYKGLPPAFALGLAGVAVDYRPSSCFYGSSSSSNKVHWPGVVPIHGPAPWAVAVPLPSSWQAVLNKDMQQLLQLGLPTGDTLRDSSEQRSLNRSAVSLRRCHSLLKSAATANMNQCILREYLLQPKVLPKGSPEAVAVHLSTPMGVAVARVTPQHVEMAVAVPDCNVVLAVPAVTGASDVAVAEELTGGASDTSGEQQQLQLGFVYEVVGALGGSSTGGSCPTDALPAAAAAVGASETRTVRCGQTVYTGVKISVKRRGELSTDTQLLTSPALSPATTSSSTTVTPVGVTSDNGDCSSLVHTVQQLHPWLALAAAALLLVQVWLQPWAVLFAVLPAVLLLLAWKPQLLLLVQGGVVHSSSSCSQAAIATAAASTEAAAAGGMGEGLGSEDEWVVVLEGALLENQPGPYLQLQVRSSSTRF